MLDLPDPDLADWLSGRRPIPADLHPPPLVAMLVRIRAAARGEP
jgi:succinate dehydrogenase flavin-adding protein (antitoxin of CptAB toxin-antitoxin module)